MKCIISVDTLCWGVIFIPWGPFSCYLWILLSLNHFGPLRVNKSFVLRAQFAALSWLFFFLLFIPSGVTHSYKPQQGSLYHPHRLNLLSLSSACLICVWNFSKLNYRKVNWSWNKPSYLFPSRLILSVAHGKGLAAFLVRAVVTCPSASQGT